MGRRNFNGFVSINNDKGNIRLRWSYRSKRYYLSLSLKYCKLNLTRAKRIAEIIESDMLSERFDTSLLTYNNFLSVECSFTEVRDKITVTNTVKPTELNLSPTFLKKQDPDLKSAIDFVDLFEYWTSFYRNRSCEKNIDYRLVRNMLCRWTLTDPEEAVGKLQREEISVNTFNRRLRMLKQFLCWLVKKKHISENPLEDVLRKRTRKIEIQTRKPFTIEETQRILSTIKNDTYVHPSSRYSHSHYYPFIYFLFSTGARNAEVVGLLVQDVDIKRNKIKIQRALARTLKGTHAKARIEKETKNGKVRELPLSPELKEVLLPLLQNKMADDLVFTSITGKCIDDRMFLRRVFKPVLKGLCIEYRTLYACRHGFASRLIAAGFNPVTTAFLLGNNPETALRNYTHVVDLPDTLPTMM